MPLAAAYALPSSLMLPWTRDERATLSSRGETFFFSQAEVFLPEKDDRESFWGRGWLRK
jgi:hypothetical protein